MQPTRNRPLSKTHLLIQKSPKQISHSQCDRRRLFTMLQDTDELTIIEFLLFSDGSTLKHDIHFFIREPVAHLRQVLPQLLRIDHSGSRLIKTLESGQNFMFGIGAGKLFAHHCQEHGKVDRTRGFTNHFLHIRIRRVLAYIYIYKMSQLLESCINDTQRCQHILQVFLVNESVAVMVNHAKRFLEFGNLLLVEHGKDVRVLTDGSLLLTTCTFCLKVREI